MISFIVLIFYAIALFTSFFSIMWGWIILWIPSAFLLIMIFGLKLRKVKHIPNLSEEANQMLQKFGHYYTMPFAGRDFSWSASASQFTGAAIAIIGIFKGFWWGIGIGIINFMVMGIVARAFNPTNFLANNIEKKAHEEIISYIMSGRNLK